MNRNKLIMMAACCGLMLLSGRAFAVPYPGNIDDFNDATDPSWSGLLNATLGNPTLNYLEFTVTGDPAADGAVVTTDPLFIGSYLPLGNGAFIKFSFSSATAAPDQLSLYFETSYGGGQTWYYSGLTTADGIKLATIGTWSGSWFSWEAGDLATDFGFAIQDVDRIGIYVANTLPGSYVYRLDDFEVGVPEPETVWMILAVLLSLGVTFRSQLAGMAGQVKARVLGG